MRVLLAFDGSDHSEVALAEVASREWPADTEIEVVTVIHSRWPIVGDPLFTVASAHFESIHEQEHDAPDLLKGAIVKILERAPQLAATSKTLEGIPHQAIVKEASDWGADLIVLGSHGYGPIRRALLGSVAAAVAVEAPCAVEIIRTGGRPPISARQALVDARAHHAS